MTRRPGSGYDGKKAAERARNAQRSYDHRNIGSPPPIVDPERREEGRRSGVAFLREYFPDTFYLPFSSEQIRIIELADKIIEQGGMQAAAMPRGSGKTSMFERLVLRAHLYALRRYSVILGSNAEAAEEILDTLMTELLINDRLYEDFPEVCHPIRMLEGVANRVKGQHINGKRTAMTWHKSKLILPTVAGSDASGGIIQAKGILSRLRGLKHKSQNGDELRPDLVLPDDPQSDQSARSQYQIKKRLAVLRGTVLGLAGPGKKITAFCPCTVIAPGDLADQLLDREKSPEWHGIRIPLMRSWPSNKPLWEKYYDIRSGELHQDLPPDESNAFYANHREAMDAGADPTWDARYNVDELSATQHAMNLIQDRGQEAVDAEFQNNPRATHSTNIAQWLLKPDEMATRIWIPSPRLALAPEWADKFTAFIDVQQRLLYWMVCAWGPQFRGHIVRYGTWPEQPSPLFTYATARHTIQLKYHGGLNAQLTAALTDLVAWLTRFEITTEKGAATIERIGVDTGWRANIINALAAEQPILLPCKGQGIMAGNKPFAEYTTKDHEVAGHHWRETPNKKKTRLLHIDTNEWKTRWHQGIATEPGQPESITLPKRPDGNAGLISNFLSEGVHEDTNEMRTVFVWTLPSNRPDNHWFDCGVGNMALASRLGVLASASENTQRRPRKNRLTPEQIAAYNALAAQSRRR